MVKTTLIPIPPIFKIIKALFDLFFEKLKNSRTRNKFIMLINKAKKIDISVLILIMSKYFKKYIIK